MAVARKRTPAPASDARPNLTVVGDELPQSAPVPEPPAEQLSASEKARSVSEALDDGDLLTILQAQQRSLAGIAEHGKAPDRIRAHQQLTVLSEKIAALREADDDGPDSVVDDAPDQPWDGTWDDGPGY